MEGIKGIYIYVFFYIIWHDAPHPLAGSAKGSGCLFPQTEGIIKSGVD